SPKPREASCRSVRCEDGLGDVADAAIHLDRVVGRVHVVDAEQASRLVLDDPRIAEVPAPAVVAQDDLAAPGFAAVFAHAGAHAVGADAVAVDADDAAVAHFDKVARRAPVGDARQERPGEPAVARAVDVGPDHVARVALEANRGEDAAVAQLDEPRIELSYGAEDERPRAVADGRAPVALGCDERQEAPFDAVSARIDERAVDPAAL